MKQKSSGKTWNLISGIVLLLLLVSEGLLLFQIWKLNMLPKIYLLILAGAVLLVTGLISLLLFRRVGGKWEKKKGHGKQIVGYVLSVLVVALCLVAQTGISKVVGTISAITAPEKVSVVLEVYVRAEDTVQSFQETGSCVVGYIEEMDPADVEEIVTELEDMLGFQVTTQAYPNVTEQVNALFSMEIDAVVLDSAYLSILETVDEFEGFEEKVTKLHDRVIEKDAPVRPELNNNKVPKELDVTKDTFLVYISGSDSRYSMLSSGRSDVNILVAVNPTTHQILMINTPRDYYLVNPASGNDSMDKLTHCGVRGVQNSIEALERLYGLEVNFHARINFSGLQTLIDAIGGVTIHSDKGFSAGGHYIQKGENHLNGAQALAFARERKNLQGGDNERGKNQMKLISGIVNQLSSGSLLENYTDILKSLEGMFSTDMPADKIGSLVQLQLSQMPKWDIHTFAVTGENGTDKCWASGWYSYVMYPHEDVVAQAAALVEAMRENKVLTEEDLKIDR